MQFLIISLNLIIIYFLHHSLNVLKDASNTTKELRQTFDDVFYPVFSRKEVQTAVEKTKELLTLMDQKRSEYESKLAINNKLALHSNKHDETLKSLVSQFIEAELEYEHQLESSDFMRHSNLAVFNGTKKPENIRNDQRNYKSMIADMDKKFEVEERLKNWEDETEC
jgi:hypothetical protein